MKKDIVQKRNGVVAKARFGTDIHEMDRSFDIEYWQEQGDEAIFEAAWELVLIYLNEKGAEPNEYEFQRTVEHFQSSRS